MHAVATKNKYLAAIDKTSVAEFPRYPPPWRVDPQVTPRISGIMDELRAIAQRRSLARASLDELALHSAADATELNRRFDVDLR
jgi:hypothetical protein